MSNKDPYVPAAQSWVAHYPERLGRWIYWWSVALAVLLALLGLVGFIASFFYEGPTWGYLRVWIVAAIVYGMGRLTRANLRRYVEKNRHD